MKEQDELAETILALPDHSELRFDGFFPGSQAFKTLQSIVREWKESEAEIRELKLERDSLKRKAKEVFAHYADRKRWTYGGFDDNDVTYKSDNRYKKDGFHVAAAALKEMEGK